MACGDAAGGVVDCGFHALSACKVTSQSSNARGVTFKLLGDNFQGFIPACRAQFSIFTDIRLIKALAAKTIPDESGLIRDPLFVDLVIDARQYTHDSPAARIEVRAARSPKWLRAARLPEGRVVFEEPCRSLRRGAYVVLLGHPTPEGLVSTPKPTAPRERAVSLGQGKRQGLFRAPSGARIHVQLTLESDQPVTVQLESPDRARAWRGVVPGKAGLNTIDLALSELRPKAGAELQGGEVLDFLSIQAGLPGQAHPLTLEYVRVYQPR